MGKALLRSRGRSRERQCLAHSALGAGGPVNREDPQAAKVDQSNLTN
jgi:hypothetical protein